MIDQVKEMFEGSPTIIVAMAGFGGLIVANSVLNVGFQSIAQFLFLPYSNSFDSL